MPHLLRFAGPARAPALLRALVLGALAAAFKTVARPPLASIDSAIQDAVLAGRAPETFLGDAANTARDPRSFITIVAIDERTLSELGAYNGGFPTPGHPTAHSTTPPSPPHPPPRPL